MDTAALVGAHIDEGQRLVGALARDGFEVAAAFWVKIRDAEGDVRWDLYIVSRLVDEQGLLSGYRAVHRALSQIPDPSLSVTEIKLVGPAKPEAKGVMELVKRYRNRLPVHIPCAPHGDVEMEEVYIYAPMEGDSMVGTGDDPRSG